MLVTEGEDRLVLDAGKALGGQAAGPNPSMVLRSALSACVAMGVQQWAAYCGVELQAVDVTVETEVDVRGMLGLAEEIAPGFGAIRLTIEVRSDASALTIDEIVGKSLRVSPLLDVFEKGQRVEQRLRGFAPGAVAEEGQ